MHFAGLKHRGTEGTEEHRGKKFTMPFSVFLRVLCISVLHSGGEVHDTL